MKEIKKRVIKSRKGIQNKIEKSTVDVIRKGSVWEFYIGETVFDKVNKSRCTVLTLNSNNMTLERRFYVSTEENGMKVKRWRTADQLEKIKEL